MRKFRSGFTMSELIIVLVIIGVLGYITFNKLFGAKTKQEIENAIKADLEAITNAADKYRLNSRNGKYDKLTIAKIAGYFPSNMKQMSAAGDEGTAITDSWVGSISFGELCRYTVGPNIGNENRTFNIAMDCSQAIADLGWNEKEQALTEQVFWEFISRKYGYSADKGLVDPSTITANSSLTVTIAADGVVTGGIASQNLDEDKAPVATDVDGIIFATDLRGF